jgi:hypothetical protein
LTQAHQDHFYQRALDNGLSVYQIAAGLAAMAISNKSEIVHVTLLAAGSVLVGALLWILSRADRQRR